MKNFTKVLLPFACDGPASSDAARAAFVAWERRTDAGTEQKRKQKWLPRRMGDGYLLESIADKLNEEGGESIGRAYSLNAAVRRALSLPPDERTAVTLTARAGKTFPFRLGNIGLYLFETNVGFLEFEIFPEGDAAAYVECNYFFSELKDEHNVCSFVRKTRAGEETVTFTAAEKARELLAEMKDLRGFDRGSRLRFSDCKPNLFGMYRCRDDGEFDGNFLTLAKNNFKLSYKVRPDGDVFTEFENIACGATVNGCFDFLRPTGDEGADAFAVSGFAENFSERYFYLYLLLLNERFTLLKRLDQLNAVELRCNARADGDIAAAQAQLIKLSRKSAMLAARCDYTTVSAQENINRWYGYVKEKLCIRELLGEINGKYDVEEKLIQLYADELENRKRQAEERAALKKEISDLRLQILAFILANVVGSLSVFTSALDILDFLGMDAMNTGWVALPAVVTALFFVWLVAETVSRARTLARLCRKRNEAENKGEKTEKNKGGKRQ